MNVCDVCGKPLSIKKRSNGRSYSRCPNLDSAAHRRAAALKRRIRELQEKKK